MIDDVLDIFEETCPKSAYSKAHHVLSRMVKTKRITFVGGISNGGKKKHVYSCRPVRNLFHEWNVGQCLKAFGWPECHTGSEVDRDILPDAELFLGEFKYFLELDTGSMRRSQVEGRWKHYEDADDALLVVTLSERRMNDLLRWSDVGYFTTLEKLSKTPWETIWTTPEGCHEAVQFPVNKSTTVEVS